MWCPRRAFSFSFSPNKKIHRQSGCQPKAAWAVDARVSLRTASSEPGEQLTGPGEAPEDLGWESGQRFGSHWAGLEGFGLRNEQEDASRNSFLRADFSPERYQMIVTRYPEGSGVVCFRWCSSVCPCLCSGLKRDILEFSTWVVAFINLRQEMWQSGGAWVMHGTVTWPSPASLEHSGFLQAWCVYVSIP